MNPDRREFLKKAGLLGGALALNPFETLAASVHRPPAIAEKSEHDLTVNILQTTDVHCQIHPHDELFWEHERAVFRKAGGYAHLATFLQRERAQNPHSFVLDTGDMFQGSELSVKTTGEAMVPILNALNYDLYPPGNWEVV